MSINKEVIINFFKRYWVFILLATIVTSLLTIRLIQVQREKPPKPLPSPAYGVLPPPQSEFSQPLGTGVIYTLLFTEASFANLPSSLPVYQTKKLTQEEALSRLAKVIVDLGFLGQPKIQTRGEKKYLIWREEENYLELDVVSGQFSFVGKNQLAENQTITISQAEKLVADKLTTWKLVENKPQTKKIEGFDTVGLELIPALNLSQATVFKISFTPTFNNYPLVSLGQAENLIEATINNQGALLTLFFSLHQIDPETATDYPLKSYEEMTNEIESGQAQIIEVSTKTGQNLPLPQQEKIREVKISSLSLVYYETTEIQDYYQPVFLLKGEITLREGTKYQASLILPALSSEWLKPLQKHFQP